MQIAGNTFELLTFYKIKSNDIMMLIKGILQTITYFFHYTFDYELRIQGYDGSHYDQSRSCQIGFTCTFNSQTTHLTITFISWEIK